MIVVIELGRVMPRPYTRIFSTMTVDGRIASRTGYSRLSCHEDFDLQHQVRAWADLVVVGSNTALIDDPRLTVRRVPSRTPLRGVVDSRLRVPPTARLYSLPGAVLITTTDHSSMELLAYERRGARIVMAGSGRVDLVEAWRLLYEELGVRRVMVEGGGSLNYALLEAGLVDEVWVTIAPYVFGAGRSVFDGQGFPGGDDMARLRVLSVRPLCGGSWVSVRYEVLWPRRPLY